MLIIVSLSKCVDPNAKVRSVHRVMASGRRAVQLHRVMCHFEQPTEPCFARLCVKTEHRAIAPRTNASAHTTSRKQTALRSLNRLLHPPQVAADCGSQYPFLIQLLRSRVPRQDSLRQRHNFQIGGDFPVRGLWQHSFRLLYRVIDHQPLNQSGDVGLTLYAITRLALLRQLVPTFSRVVHVENLL